MGGQNRAFSNSTFGPRVAGSQAGTCMPRARTSHSWVRCPRTQPPWWRTATSNAASFGAAAVGDWTTRNSAAAPLHLVPRQDPRRCRVAHAPFACPFYRRRAKSSCRTRHAAAVGPGAHGRSSWRGGVDQTRHCFCRDTPRDSPFKTRLKWVSRPHVQPKRTVTSQHECQENRMLPRPLPAQVLGWGLQLWNLPAQVPGVVQTSCDNSSIFN